MPAVCAVCLELYRDRFEGGVLAKAGVRCQEHAPGAHPVVSPLEWGALIDEKYRELRDIVVGAGLRYYDTEDHDPGDEDRS